MLIGVPTEIEPGERRVALVPETVARLVKAGNAVRVQRRAGHAAAFVHATYEAAGATLAPDAAGVFGEADLIAKVQRPNDAELKSMRAGQVLLAFLSPLGDPASVERYAKQKITALSMDAIPRITRAQSMDALSSQANIGGYKAALLAAEHLPRFFPMLTTAAGTITPAKVLILGAGVAGLQAIATARRLGAVVSAYDLRAAVKEQIQSLGDKVVVLDLESGEGQGGYAKAMDEAFYKRQRELLTAVLKEQDVVITTAAVPGRKAPILITTEMAEAMQPGSVIVDIAAERGGNCELTRAGETVMHRGISIVGAVNLPSRAPYHASQMYATNVVNLLKLMVNKEGVLTVDQNDEIIRETLVTHGGKVVNSRVGELLEAGVASA